MEQAIATFSNFPQTPRESGVFVEMCVNEITSGERNPLDFEILLKNLEDTISAIRKDKRVKDCIENEASKYSEKIFNYGNYEFTKVSKPIYDYSNDSTWSELNEKLKNRETFLKSIKPDIKQIADGDTGEIIMPPLVKYSSFLTKKYKG